MKKVYSLITALILTMSAMGQTLNVRVGSVTYQFPAAQAGMMKFQGGMTLTVLGKEFALADIDAITVDKSEVTNNLVRVEYNDATASVYVAGNVAQYVTPTVSGAHVSIAQSNTEDVDDDEITYQLSGTTADGSLTLSGSYKCTLSLDGVTLTNPSGAAINVTNSKRIQLSAKKGTTSTLTDGNGSQKACIYSKGQLQIQGNGTLNVVGNLKHGIKSASYISIKNLTLNITKAVGDGISCEEYFQLKSGSVTISGVGDDGIQCDLGGDTSTGEILKDEANNIDAHEDEDSGNMYFENGTMNITATATATKCVKSAGNIYVSGGTYTLNAKGAIDNTDASNLSYAAGFKADGGFTQSVGYISKVPYLELAAQCQSALEARTFLEHDTVDAIFCDINMPDLNGMDFVKSLIAAPLVVFTTAYPEYALEGFKVNAVDYLLKPFGLQEFQRAANRVREMKEMKDAKEEAEEAREARDSSRSAGAPDDTIFLKTDHRIVKVSIASIRYVEAMSEYLKVWLDDQPKPLVTLLSMKKMEDSLPATFMRIHRSYIINLTKIVEVNKNRVIMDADTYLPIGELYREAFQSYLDTKFLGR